MSFEFYINSMFANFYITICGILDKFTVYPHILKRDILHPSFVILWHCSRSGWKHNLVFTRPPAYAHLHGKIIVMG